MPAPVPPRPSAPVTDDLLAQLIALWRQPQAEISRIDASLVEWATLAALLELQRYRAILGRQYARAMVEGALHARAARPFVANRGRLPGNLPGGDAA